MTQRSKYNKKDWYGKLNNGVRCPVPGCGHIGSFISKIHCRMHHDMEREEVHELYGIPESVGRGWAFSADRRK